MDWSPPGFSVQGILQPRILGWVAFCPPGYLPNPGKELMSPESPALQADSLPLSHQGNLYPVDSPVSILFLNFNFNVVTSLSVRNSGRGRRDYYPESVNMTSTSVALWGRLAFPMPRSTAVGNICGRHGSTYLNNLVILGLPDLGLQSWQSPIVLLPSLQCSILLGRGRVWWVKSFLLEIQFSSWSLSWNSIFPLSSTMTFFVEKLWCPYHRFLPQYCYL